jgi:catechol 2,3-dioxygenase-like lactoylglutathione lyase family enzyme
MPQRLNLTALLVDEYDAALAFFVGALGFEMREDT